MKRIFSKKTDERGNKDWRKPYVGRDWTMNFDSSCRHGGNCSYCEENRKFRGKRQDANTRDQLED